MAEMLHKSVHQSVIVTLVLRYSVPTLTLRLLGPIFLGTPSCPQGARIGRKGQALLAAVAASRQEGVSRSSLMAWLWPSQSEDDARNALRQCLHQVRLVLHEHADWLETQGDRLRLRAGLGAVDLWQFEDLAAHNGAQAMAAAADLYRGDYAQDLIAENDPDQWLWIERERLREVAHGLVVRILECDDGPALESATRLARRLLVADPVHEGCYRALMLLYARAGLGAKAMRVWEDCRRVLRQELGVGPSPQTTAAYESLRLPLQERAVGAEPARQPAAPATTGSAWRVSASPMLAQSDALALDHMLRGWQLFCEFTAEANPRARAEFAAVLVQQPDNAEAIVRFGWTHFFDYVGGWSRDTALSLHCAAEAARKAIACNPRQATAYALQGKVLLWQKEHAAAIRQLQHAVSLAPGSAWTHFHLADGSMWDGQHDDALLHVRRALQLDANDHGTFLTIEGFALFFKGDLLAARGALTRAVTRNPSYPWTFGALAAVHVETGDLTQAQEAALRARQLSRRSSLDFAQQVLPIRHENQRLRLVADWRQAGMPQHEGKPAFAYNESAT